MSNAVIFFIILLSLPLMYSDVVSRSRDRSILVRGTWGETHRPLREEAQQHGGSGQRGYSACRQDVGTASRQHQKQREPGECAGWRGQGLVTMTACPLPFIHKLLVSSFFIMTEVVYLFVLKCISLWCLLWGLGWWNHSPNVSVHKNAFYID